MFLTNKKLKNKNLIIRKKMWVQKKTQYGGDVVMFLPNKIIKNKKLNYPQKEMFALHVVLKPCAMPSKNPWFYCTWFSRALQMVLKPCARHPKQAMVLLYIV